MQLINLKPEDLGEWEKPKAVTKKKEEAKGKKIAGEEEKKRKRRKKKNTKRMPPMRVEWRATTRPRRHTSLSRPCDQVMLPPAIRPLRPRNGRLPETPHRHDASAVERRTKKLRGARTGMQPTLMQMGFGK